MKKSFHILAVAIGWLIVLGGLALIVGGIVYATMANTPQNLQTNQFGNMGVGLGWWAVAAGVIVTWVGIAILLSIKRTRPRSNRSNNWKNP